MHFLTENKSSGGHLLDFELKNAKIEIDNLYEFEMELPNSDEFNKADLSGDQQDSLAEAEGNPEE